MANYTSSNISFNDEIKTFHHDEFLLKSFFSSQWNWKVMYLIFIGQLHHTSLIFVFKMFELKDLLLDSNLEWNRPHCVGEWFKGIYIWMGWESQRFSEEMSWSWRKNGRPNWSQFFYWFKKWIMGFRNGINSINQKQDALQIANCGLCQ